MARKKRQLKSVSKAKAKSKINKEKYKCEHEGCSLSYVTLSNLNNHMRIKHNNIRWDCPFCHDLQVSKDKHELHIKRKHRNQWRKDMNLNQNQVIQNEMTDEAKRAKIKDQQKTIDSYLDLNVKLRTKLIEAKMKLVECKRKLVKACSKLEEFGYKDSDLKQAVDEEIEESDEEIEEGMQENEKETQCKESAKSGDINIEFKETTEENSSDNQLDKGTYKCVAKIDINDSESDQDIDIEACE